MNAPLNHMLGRCKSNFLEGKEPEGNVCVTGMDHGSRETGAKLCRMSKYACTSRRAASFRWL